MDITLFTRALGEAYTRDLRLNTSIRLKTGKFRTLHTANNVDALKSRGTFMRALKTLLHATCIFFSLQFLKLYQNAQQ